MFNLQWDAVQMFRHPQTGAEMPEWAVSTVGTTTVELSMRDERIWRELPREEWLGVMASPVNNVKMNRIDDAWVTLIGFGRPNDPAGNLMFVRVRSYLGILANSPRSPDAEHFARVTKLVMTTLQCTGHSAGPEHV
jgi:hypothetical protein